MKSIEELGISPTPWEAVRWRGSDERTYCSVKDSSGGAVCDCLRSSNRIESDARIMAAAPELYESLEEAQRETCWKCHGSEVPRGDEVCDQCIVAGWIDALKKAGGAE